MPVFFRGAVADFLPRGVFFFRRRRRRLSPQFWALSALLEHAGAFTAGRQARTHTLKD